MARRFVGGAARAGIIGTVVVCTLATACGEPSRLPTVLPLTPSSDTFSLSGTVTETAPTTSTAIPHALLALDGINNGMSTTADETGRFSFGQVKGGRFSLVASRAGYQTGTFAIELKRDADYAIRLSPAPSEPQEITETHTATLDWSVPPCRRVEYDCWHRYSFGVRHSGYLTVQLEWIGNAELVLSLNGWDPLTSGQPVRVSAGSTYSVDVTYRRGTEPARYTLVMTHPN
jgi:hypothetical protein